MESLIKADVFFFITAVAVIIFTVLGSVVLFYLAGILKNVKESTDSLKGKIEEGSKELESMRRKITESILFNFIFAKKHSSRKKK